VLSVCGHLIALWENNDIDGDDDHTMMMTSMVVPLMMVK